MKFRALIVFSISVAISATATDDDSSHSESAEHHSDDLVEEANSDVHVEHASKQSPVAYVPVAVAAHPTLDVVAQGGHDSHAHTAGSHTSSLDADADTDMIPVIADPIPEKAGAEHVYTPSNPHDNMFHVDAAPAELVSDADLAAKHIEDSVKHSQDTVSQAAHTPSAPVLESVIPAEPLSHLDNHVAHVDNPVVAAPVETENEPDDIMDEVTAEKESEKPRDPLANSMQAVSHIVRHPLILPYIHIPPARASLRRSFRPVCRRAS